MPAKYNELIQRTKNHRSITLNQENDSLSLTRFIKLYEKTYDDEIRWAEHYTRLLAQIKELTIKKQAQQHQLTKEELANLYDRVVNHINLSYLAIVLPLSKHHELAPIENFEVEHQKRLASLVKEYELLVPQLPLSAEKLVGIWKTIWIEDSSNECMQLEKELAELMKELTDKNNSMLDFEKKRRLLKYFTLSLLKEYPIALSQKGIQSEECQVTIFGRNHGHGLPFQYSKGELNHVSRIQFIYISNKNNLSVLMDLGSIFGTKGKLKFNSTMNSSDISKALYRSDESASLSSFVSESVADHNSQFIPISKITAERVVQLNDQIKNYISNMTPGEFDFSTNTIAALGIAPIPLDSICCIQMAANQQERYCVHLELAFKEGAIKEVKAINQKEYASNFILDLYEAEQDNSVSRLATHSSLDSFFPSVSQSNQQDNSQAYEQKVTKV
ncbi:MAG: hypothetical protein ACOVQX_03185 [Legionella sp.]